MATVGPCALCGSEKPLKGSHLIPKFVGRRLAKDAGMPYFRGENPNVREQDTKKMPLLCGTCENIFSVGDSAFAAVYYHPTRDGREIEVVWTERLARFAASVKWRNIMLT